MHGSCEIWDTLCPVSLYLMHNITGVDYKTNDGFSVQNCWSYDIQSVVHFSCTEPLHTNLQGVKIALV